MVLRGEFAEVEVLLEWISAKHKKARAVHLGNLSAREPYQKLFVGHKGLFNVAKHKNDGFHRYQ